jgi:hypothetical protein
MPYSVYVLLKEDYHLVSCQLLHFISQFREFLFFLLVFDLSLPLSQGCEWPLLTCCLSLL